MTFFYWLAVLFQKTFKSWGKNESLQPVFIELHAKNIEIYIFRNLIEFSLIIFYIFYIIIHVYIFIKLQVKGKA